MVTTWDGERSSPPSWGTRHWRTFWGAAPRLLPTTSSIRRNERAKASTTRRTYPRMLLLRGKRDSPKASSTTPMSGFGSSSVKKDSLPALKWVADLLKKYEVAGDVEVSRMVSSLYANGHTNEAALLAR